MSDSSAPDEINNIFKNEGPAGPSNVRLVMNNDGSTVGFFNGKKNRINSWMNAQGAGIGIISPNPSGPGDGKKMAPGRRFTKSHLAGNADASQPTFMKISNPDGTMISFDSGGGRNSTILLATGDGKQGIVITKGYVALFVNGTELIVHDGKITFTYALIQETIKGPPGDVPVKTYTKLAAAEPNQGGSGVMGSVIPGAIGSGGAPGSSGSTGGGGWNNIKGGSPHVISPT